MGFKTKLTAEEFEAIKGKTVTMDSLYAEKDGAYILNGEAVDGLRIENVDGLLKNKSELLKEAEKAKRERAEALAELEKARAQQSESDGKPNEKIEAVRKSLLDEFAKKEAALAARLEKREAQLKRDRIRAEAAQALAKHKGDAALLMPHIESALSAVETESGDYKVRVVGPDGSEMWSKASGSAGDPMPVEEYVSSVLKQRFPSAFEGTGSSGSGATGSARAGGTNGRYIISAAEARKDPRAFQRVEAEAIKAGTHAQIVE